MAFGNVSTNSGDATAQTLTAQVQNAQQMNAVAHNDELIMQSAAEKKLSKRHRKQAAKAAAGSHGLSSAVELRLATTDARTLPFTQWVLKLRGPARWIGEREQRAFYESGYGSGKVNQVLKSRLLRSVIFGIILGIVGSGLGVIRHFTLAQVTLTGVATTAVVGLGLWLLGSRAAMRAYQIGLYQRQLVFIQFERLLIPYLAEMKNGTSLFSMLKRVMNRLDDEGDKILIQRLMGAMADGASTSTPFVDFARRFGGSDAARLFMLSIYQMYIGNYNDAVVKDLGDQSNREMMQQVDLITKRKLKRFNNLTTWLTMATMIVLMGFLGLSIVNQFSQIFNQM